MDLEKKTVLPGESLDPSSFFQITELYPTGRVKGVVVFGHFFTGRQIREKLGLRSNWFTVKAEPAGVTFTRKGLWPRRRYVPVRCPGNGCRGPQLPGNPASLLHWWQLMIGTRTLPVLKVRGL